MVLPFSRALLLSTSVAALYASGLTAYAVGGNEPEFVADFAGILNSGAEYYRSGGNDTDFDSVFTHTKGDDKPFTMTDSDGNLKWGAHNCCVNFSQWTVTSETLTGGQSDPDGGSGAYSVVAGGTSFEFISASTAEGNVAPNGNATFEVIAKNIDAGWIRIRAFGNTGADCWFNLSTGAKGTKEAGASDSRITSLGDGWYKLAVDMTLANQTITTTQQIGIANADNTTACTNGTGFYVYAPRVYRSDLGGMVNNPDRGDSYVPTTTAARFLPRRNHHVWNGSSWEKAGILIEPAAATNLALNCRAPSTWTVDFFVNDTNSATTGIDGVSNSAGTITAALAGGCFIGQDITVSDTIVSSVYLKRLSGTGAVALTQGAPVGSELVTNGTFDSDVSGWTAQANTTLAWNASGAMDVTSTSSVSGAYTSFSTVSGRVYRLTIGSISGGNSYLRIGTTAGGNDVGNANIINSGNNPYYFIAKSSTTYLTLAAFSGSSTVTYDNVSVTEVASAALTEATAWERLITPAASLTNPRVCIVFANNTDSVGVDFLQVEVGSVATSPILTTSSTVTRAAETLTVAGANLPANTTGVSVQMQGRMTYADLGTDAQRTFWRWYNGASDFLLCDLDTDGADTGEVNANQSDTTGGSGTVAIDAYSPGINVAYNIASRHSNTDINLAVDGTAGTADATPTALHDASSDTFQVAHNLQGTVGMLRVWGVGLSDTDLESAS